MGMRANITYVAKNGKVSTTSLQWATQTDRTIAHELTTKGDKTRAVRKIFKNATKFSHLSCIDRVEALETSTFSNEHRITPRTALLGAQTDGDDSYRHTTVKKLEDSGSSLENWFTNFHFEDGLSLLWDERDPDYITFGTIASSGGYRPALETLSLDELSTGVEVSIYARR